LTTNYFIIRYPLIFKRGRMRMAPPPSEVQKVENTLQDDPMKASEYNFMLVPSVAAQRDAESLKLSYKEGDVPLFLADRLAFASNDGPQVSRYNI